MKNTEIEPGTRRWHRHRLAAWVLTGATVLALVIMSILGGPAHATEHPTPVTFTRVHDGIPRSASYEVAFLDETGVSSRPDYLTDVRPLVVIDPAEVDRDALVGAILEDRDLEFILGAIKSARVTDIILSHLGLDGAR